MKTLGIHQFQQKKFKLMGLKGEFAPHLGDIPFAFQMLIFGNSGNGKTEYCIRFAKSLCKHGKVAWLSYEQGHGYDLQTACNRNKMHEVSGQFYIIDPNDSRNYGKSYLDELDEYLSKRNSPDFIFIDSVDYTRFSFEDYCFLKEKYGKRKAFIFISHANGKRPKSAIGERILYDGGIGIRIDKFIAYVDKNRFGGFEELLVFEQRARELNPSYFLAKLKAQTNGKQGVLSVEKQAETPEKTHIPPSQTMGVDAESTPPNPLKGEQNPRLKVHKTPVTA